MKNLINKSKYVILGLITLMVSCTDGFEELNKDPKNPIQTNESYLFTYILSINEFGGGWYYNQGNPFYYQLSQVGTNANEPKDFNLAEAMRGIEEGIWSPYRRFMNNSKYLTYMIESKGDVIGVETYNNRLALIKILNARMTFHATDFHGDIPYFEAGTAMLPENPVFRPKYDKQEVIYKSLLEDLNWAFDHITEAAGAFGKVAEIGRASCRERV